MNKQDKDYIDIVIQGVHASIMAIQDSQKIRDDGIIEKLNKTISLQETANSRIYKLEKYNVEHPLTCPQIKSIDYIKKSVSFWIWWTIKPRRLALLIPIFAVFIAMLKIIKFDDLITYIIKLL